LPVVYIFSYSYYLRHWDGFKVAAKGCPVDEVEGVECPEVALTQECLDRLVFHGVFYRRLDMLVTTAEFRTSAILDD